jgi:biopolymer transport protein ExbD
MKVRKKRRITNDQPQLEMTPMIDVVFQLLIFFIVTIKQEDIYSMLSAAAPAGDETPTTTPPNVLRIQISKTGLSLGDIPVSLALLEKRLASITETDKSVSVVLSCTGDSPHKYLVQTLDICHKLELRNLAIFSM